MTIFAIDDELAALGLLEMSINEALPEAEVKSFRYVKDLLEAIKTEKVDIAFMDIEMPGMNGLELCKALQDQNPKINIIFVTGYSQYAFDALKLYASDYIMKPVTPEAIKQSMANLRYPIEDENARVTIKTFGHFSVFLNGNPIVFRMEKSKELLAYLVDREGASVTRREAAATLYEESDYDRNVQKYLSRVATWLTEDLEAAGISGLFRNVNGEYSIDTSIVECDLYKYLAGETELFHGEYMEQYSWGEDRKALMY